jgi:uncharacterized protein (TIGR02246 family)
MNAWMRGSVWLLAASLAATAGCAASPQVDVAAETRAIRSVFRQFQDGMNSKNADAVVALYAPDAIIAPFGAPTMHTREELRDFLNGAFQSGLSNLKTTSDRLEIAASGDLAVDIGTFSLTMNAAPVTGRYAVGLKRIDGAWKVFLDTDNTATTESTPAPATTR